MITHLAGKVIFSDNENKEIGITTTSGVGYVVKSICLTNIAVDQPVELYIYTSISENNWSLWGFHDYLQLKVFKLLLTVSGVGPTSAANLLSRFAVNDFLRFILNEEVDKLHVPGVGEKTAQKIVLELRSKVKSSDYFLRHAITEGTEAAISNNTEIEDAIMALTTLGYDKHDVRKFFSRSKAEGSTQELIKVYLSSLK